MIQQNLRAIFYIWVRVLDLNISNCCVTLQLPKGQSAAAPLTLNKLIVCAEECVMKQLVKLHIFTASVYSMTL